MRIRVALLAIIATLPTSAGAQPGKADPAAKPPPPPIVAAAPVVMASAGDVRRTPAPVAENLSQPVRRPAPRVTTCRCGDPQPGEDQQPDE